MDKSIAHFDLVKNHNRKLIRNTLRTQNAMRIAEIADETGLSYPTVSSLLKELVKSKEVVVNTKAKSTGGRPGQRFELNSEYQYALIMYFFDSELKQSVYDSYGRLVWSNKIPVSEELDSEEIGLYTQKIKEKFKKIAIVVIGIPGTTARGRILSLSKYNKLEGINLEEYITSRIDVEVIIENDINAISLFDTNTYSNFAYIVCEDERLDTGIVVNGEVIRGNNGYAGDISNLCGDISESDNAFATSIFVLSCVLNLPDIMIYGKNCDNYLKENIITMLKETLIEEKLPNVHVVDDIENRYKKGLLKLVTDKWEQRD